MMAYNSRVVSSIGFSLMLLSPLTTAAATKADIEGKKVCWGPGDWKTFHPDGKVTSPIAGEGTWAINKAGIISVKFPTGPYSGVITIKGAGAVEYSGSWAGTPSVTATGFFCD